MPANHIFHFFLFFQLSYSAQVIRSCFGWSLDWWLRCTLLKSWWQEQTTSRRIKSIFMHFFDILIIIAAWISFKNCSFMISVCFKISLQLKTCLRLQDHMLLLLSTQFYIVKEVLTLSRSWVIASLHWKNIQICLTSLYCIFFMPAWPHTLHIFIQWTSHIWRLSEILTSNFLLIYRSL